MQFAIERHLFKDLATVGLKCRSEVVNLNAAQLRHQPIGAFGGYPTQPEVINPLLAPSADNIVALGNLLQEHRYVGRIVLQVTVHGDNVLAASVVETRSQR